MPLANGDLAFKGCSTNCSVGLNFWSENLPSAGDITGEASLSCLLLSIRADRAALSPVSKGKHKWGKHKKKTHFGAPNKTCGRWWLKGPGWGHLLLVGFWWYLAWGVGCKPGCFSSGVGHQPGHRAGVTSKRRWLIFATDLLTTKPFLPGWWRRR